MVETCCGCCSVETGTTVIAIWNILGAIVTVIRDSIAVNLMINYPETISQVHYPGFENSRALYITSCFVGIVFALIYGVVSGILLSGARSRQYRLCLPWLYWNYIALTLLGLVAVVLFIICAVSGEVKLGFAILLAFGMSISIALYFVGVVQRFVNELKAA